MNFRLNSFFWVFASILAGQHILAALWHETGSGPELTITAQCLAMAGTIWLLVVPTEWLVRNRHEIADEYAKRLAAKPECNPHHCGNSVYDDLQEEERMRMIKETEEIKRKMLAEIIDLTELKENEWDD